MIALIIIIIYEFPSDIRSADASVPGARPTWIGLCAVVQSNKIVTAFVSSSKTKIK